MLGGIWLLTDQVCIKDTPAGTTPKDNSLFVKVALQQGGRTSFWAAEVQESVSALQGPANTDLGLETTIKHRGTLVITIILVPLKPGPRRRLKPENECKWQAVVALSSLVVQCSTSYSLNILILTFFVCL